MDENDAAGDEGFLEADLTVDDLGAAFAQVAGDQPSDESDPDSVSGDLENNAEDESEDDGEEDSALTAIGETEDDERIPTPEQIVESALFVGHPENEPLTATRIASIMRDVSADEVVQIIENLNESYREQRQAFRIVPDELGFRMTTAPEYESVRRGFLGKVRETTLNVASIEVLALVAYQPGIMAQTIDDQRGRPSGAILNQLVRRQLLMIERVEEEVEGSGGRKRKKKVAHYYPTERFLYLFEMESLADLPQVEQQLID